MSLPNFSRVTADYDVLVLWYLTVWEGGGASTLSTTTYYQRAALWRNVGIDGAGVPYDGIYYGVIKSISSVKYGIEQQILEGGGLVAPAVTIVISRDQADDTWFQELIGRIQQASDGGIQSKVEIYCIQHGSSLSPSTDLVFTGYVNHGIKITRQDITITCSDPLSFTTKKFPTKLFGEDPDLEIGKARTAIPIIYGDFSTTRDEFTVPATLLDTSPGINKLKFRLCYPNSNGIVSIGDYVRWVYGDNLPGVESGTQVKFRNLDITSYDLSEGYFYAAKSEEASGELKHRYNEADRFYVRYVKGNSNDLGRVITNPITALKEILYSDARYLYLSQDWFDTSSFLDLIVKFDSLATAKIKMYLDEQLPLLTFIQKMLVSFGLILYYDAGKYHLDQVSYYQFNDPDDSSVFEVDAFTKDSGIQIEIGKKDWIVDAVIVECNESPIDHKPRDEAMRGVSGSMTADLAENAHKISCPWVADPEYAMQRASEVYGLRAVQPVIVEATVPLLGLGDDLSVPNWVRFVETDTSGKQSLLMHFDINERNLQVLDYEKNYQTGLTRIRAANTTRYVAVATWRDDDDPNWTDSTANQRAVFGYWTDDSGYCDPSSPPSSESDDSCFMPG